MGKYLVTGATGFIGSHLARSLVQDGHEVTILDIQDPRMAENHVVGAKVIKDSITNESLVQRLFNSDLEGCFHLAAIASVQQCTDDWINSHDTNSKGTVILMNAAKNHKTPFVYASSAAVYGPNLSIPLQETEKFAPLSAYGVDKVSNEMNALVADRIHGVPNRGLRFFNVYGPGQDPSSPYSGVISIFANRILQGQPLTFFGDGQQTRDFIYVGDVVRALRLAMDDCQKTRTGHDVFNVCTGTQVTLEQLAQTLEDITQTTVQKTYAPARSGDIQKSCGNPQWAQEKLGFEAAVSLREGLSKLLDFERRQVA